eukprot:TRINITY_DN5093_c0_g1_i3.p1 TRINITY_DN5093_c0_g1~~TRINITY_DN5093_c0_g1_i3.p1  ORF type:complete len:204 (-),score=16.72 TRINITY_DN5093_c0_g1_i3:472-1083(-)
MKSKEEDYGNRFKELCNTVETVHLSILLATKHRPQVGLKGPSAQTTSCKVSYSAYRSVVFNTLSRKISGDIQKAYEEEEEQLKKKVEIIIEGGMFDPCEYGQGKLLANCPLKRSIETLKGLNNAAAPFEAIKIIQRTHKQITKEVEEYGLSIGRHISINGDIAIASLMTVFLNSQISNPIKWSIFVQYFSYIDYNMGEVSIFV